MDGLGTGAPRRLEDARPVEVALAGRGGPIGTATSARETCGAPRSASENTATLRMPSSRQARITRTAISPRFAMSKVENIGTYIR